MMLPFRAQWKLPYKALIPKQLGRTEMTVRLCSALGAGLLAFGVLAGLQRPIILFLRLSPEVSFLRSARKN